MFTKKFLLKKFSIFLFLVTPLTLDSQNLTNLSDEFLVGLPPSVREQIVINKLLLSNGTSDTKSIVIKNDSNINSNSNSTSSHNYVSNLKKLIGGLLLGTQGYFALKTPAKIRVMNLYLQSCGDWFTSYS